MDNYQFNVPLYRTCSRLIHGSHPLCPQHHKVNFPSKPLLSTTITENLPPTIPSSKFPHKRTQQIDIKTLVDQLDSSGSHISRSRSKTRNRSRRHANSSRDRRGIRKCEENEGKKKNRKTGSRHRKLGDERICQKRVRHFQWRLVRGLREKGFGKVGERKNSDQFEQRGTEARKSIESD